MSHALTPTLAARFASIALGHVEREYPSKLDQVLTGPGDVQSPRVLHPIFFGSFDWHSCVHGYWTLARVLRRYPHGERANDIRALLDRQITEENVAGELAYLDKPFTAGFERPYGWAWLLKLQSELELAEASRWADTLRPLAAALAAQFPPYLEKLTYPLRAGTHGNTAFAARLALDYGDSALNKVIGDRSIAWFGADVDCPAWEPSGDDFLSPALMEAELMRRVLDHQDFTVWLDRFLPRLAQQQPTSLFHPAVVSDPSDGKIAHLDGLNLSRAWCWRALTGALNADDPRRMIMLEAADRHLDSSLPAVAGDYMGEHWLASFALLALEA